MGIKERSFRYWIKLYCYNNDIILYIKRHAPNKYLFGALLLICLPFFLINAISSIFYEILYGTKRIENLIIKDNNKNFKYELAIVAIAKNEGPYLKEWIEYHQLVGVDKFYLYDNESNDSTHNILLPYIESGIVEYTFLEGTGKQLYAYNDAIRKHKQEVRFMAFIDLDEYIMPSQPYKPITSIIKYIISEAHKGAVGVGINWAIYGSSGYINKQNGLITQTFFKRAPNNHWGNSHIKVICNPRFIKNYISPHYPLLIKGAYCVNENTYKRIWGWGTDNIIYKNIRINHYFTKSKQEYIEKQNRGLADRKGKYNMNNFYQYDLNDIYDDSMKAYSKDLQDINQF